MPFAHSRNAAGHRHDLIDHLRGVARLATEFAEPFGAQDAAHYVGLWHDLGKFHPEWQRYLLACEQESSPDGSRRRLDHKAAGASVAFAQIRPLGLLIQAHHGGLRSRAEFESWFQERRNADYVAESLRLARLAIVDLEPPGPVPLPSYLRDKLAAELFLRLLFSALVDADFLDTEAHVRPVRAASRQAPHSLAGLWGRFEESHRPLEQLPIADSDTVARVRREIYESCLTAAAQPPGLFRLTVPTGGGKTLSGMAFALRHAIQHGLRRIVVAVPFISITEQTADAYRGAFASPPDEGPETVETAAEVPAVLEHHSQAGFDDHDRDGDSFVPAAVWSRLAAENWDAPIIVTTTVQLFESLFNDRTSAARKLHRLARSVIILDEAQALPPHLLAPILDVLRHLCQDFGATVVLSTATPPAFDAIPAFAGIAAREIVPEPGRHFVALRRVEYEWRIDPPLTWPEVANLMVGASQALAIVNTKSDAIALLDALDDADALHLSTLLCGAHRRRVIAQIRQRLDAGQPCRLVSTQVVEAGVNLDFPLVLRAMGPLDSIIQAAGRCNREGRLSRGRVIVFQPADGGLPPGAYRLATQATVSLLGVDGGASLDPNDPAHCRRYFESFLQLLGTRGTDRERIQELRANLDFSEVAQRFKMIDPSESVVVTDYGNPQERDLVRDTLDRLIRGVDNPRLLLRRLQPYTVSLYRHAAQGYRRESLITDVLPGLGQWLGAYHPVRGLSPGTSPGLPSVWSSGTRNLDALVV